MSDHEKMDTWQRLEKWLKADGWNICLTERVDGMYCELTSVQQSYHGSGPTLELAVSAALDDAEGKKCQ